MTTEALRFTDRRDAGRRLAERLTAWEGRQDLVILALPRGGVPVAFEVAAVLQAPLDVWIVRKLGMPGREEVAMGAIASGGITVVNEGVVDLLADAKRALSRAIAKETAELQRREALYRGERAAPLLKGKIVILIDDGLATGATMRAAVRALKQHGIARCVVAVPVGSREACESLLDEADEVICLTTPELFYSVGEFYQDFEQTADAEVTGLLKAAATAERGSPLSPGGKRPPAGRESHATTPDAGDALSPQRR